MKSNSLLLSSRKHWSNGAVLVQHIFLPINTILYKTIYQMKWAGSLWNFFLQHTNIRYNKCYNDHWYSTLKDYTVLLCIRSPAITRSNAELLTIWPPKTIFWDISMRLKYFHWRKCILKCLQRAITLYQCTNGLIHRWCYQALPHVHWTQRSNPLALHPSLSTKSTGLIKALAGFSLWVMYFQYFDWHICCILIIRRSLLVLSAKVISEWKSHGYW